MNSQHVIRQLAVDRRAILRIAYGFFEQRHADAIITAPRIRVLWVLNT
jgi:hypothetical protein